MNCQDYELLINKKLDRCLSPREASLLDAHLAACPECVQMAEEYLLLDQLLAQNIAQVSPPADLCSSVMAALPEQPVPIRAASSTPKRRRPVWRWVSTGVAAAAVVLGFMAASWFEQSVPGSEVDAPPIVAEQDMPDLQQTELSRPVQVVKDSQQPLDTDPPAVADPPEREQPEQTQQPETPANTEVPVEADPVDPPVADPPKVEAPVDVTYKNEFSLPPVAYGNTAQGDYSLLTLASVEGYDATLPLVNGSTVTFYVETEDACLEYQVDINGAAPDFLGETESLPSARSTANCESLDDLDDPCVEAVSANGLAARNYGGEKQGLWLINGEEETQISEIGGGSLVSWSSDGNKVLFTDGDEHLHIYYVAENILLDLNATPVHSFCWGSDGRTIVFSALDAETGYYSIFTVIVP